jgi:topoisomerase IA-like protein
MGPSTPEVQAGLVANSLIKAKYAATIDRQSARELLADRLEAGAAKARAEEQVAAGGEDRLSYPKPSKKRTTKAEPKDGVVTEVLQSQAAKEFMRTAAREIARGVFGIGRR